MREIIELHERIAALVGNELSEDGIHFTRDDGEVCEDWEVLPTDLQEEIVSLRAKVDSLLPDDFDYYAVLGLPDDPPLFGVTLDEAPAGGTADGAFDPRRSLYDQLQGFDWEERRKLAEKNAQILVELSRALERTSKPLPPAKQFQRLLREETRDFIKEKRRDAERVHVMYWQEGDGIMEIDFADGEALRAALPDLVGEGADIVTIVAYGKPLPVEKIDALKAVAIETYADQPLRKLDDPDEVDAGVIEVEAEVTEVKPVALEEHPPQLMDSGSTHEAA